MIKKITDHKWEVAIFAVILCVGIFVRTYHFSDWLHFEIDQTYDTNIVSRAVENGAGDLPLLGPTAGGGRALRLGPAFYYLEYVSAKIFGNDPPGHAAAVLILSILALPLLYFFSRRYFSVPVSLAILAIYSVSIYAVSYSRFSWSPNVLPFLTMASFYSLLRSVDTSENKKDKWFLVAVFFLTILTQIHFNAFFVVPAIAGTFLLVKRPRFAWRTWIWAVVIAVVLYSPLIANEIKTGGENLRFFSAKLSKSQSSRIPTKRAIVGNFQKNAAAYFFIITGRGEMNSNDVRYDDFKRFDRETVPFWAGIVFFLVSLFVLCFNMRKEKNITRKNFLILCSLWLFWSFLYFYSLAKSYRIYPRFFLLASPLAAIFLGLILEKIDPGKNKRRLVILIIISGLLFGLNLLKINNFFHDYKTNSFSPVERGDAFPDTRRIKLEDFESVSTYLILAAKENGRPVYLESTSEFEPVFWYFLGREGINYIGEISPENIYREANYFVINKNPRSRGLRPLFDISEENKFGMFPVYRLAPKAEAIIADRPEEKDKEKYLQTRQIDDLMTWKKLFLPYDPDGLGS